MAMAMNEAVQNIDRMDLSIGLEEEVEGEVKGEVQGEVSLFYTSWIVCSNC